MRTIVEGIQAITRVLGKPKAQNCIYRLMKYVVHVKVDDSFIMNNVITGKVVALSKDEAQLLNQLPAFLSPWMNGLIEDHFLVPTDYNEKNTVDHLRVVMRRLSQKHEINGYTVLTTTECNARCYYCYQASYVPITMSEETANQLVDFIMKHKSDLIRFNWFGGEPLIAQHRIDQITSMLSKRGALFTSAMISNGYLFNEELIDKAYANWNLHRVQITLDGTERIYNTTKAYVSAVDNPYQKVLRNIDLLLKRGIHVIIRLNISGENTEDIKYLVHELYERYHSSRNIDLYVHALFDECLDRICTQDHIKKRQNLLRAEQQANEMIEALGLVNHHPHRLSLSCNKCLADSQNAIVVFPDGNIYKCDHANLDEIVGNLQTGITNQELVESYKKTQVLQKCAECPLYPSCIQLEKCLPILDKELTDCSLKVRAYEKDLVKLYTQHHR